MTKPSSLALSYAARRAAGRVLTPQEPKGTKESIVAKVLARRSKPPADPVDELTEEDMDLVDEEPIKDDKEARRALIASIVGKQRD